MNDRFQPNAKEIIRRCRVIAECSEDPGFTTRTYLSEPMHKVHALLREWMERASMSVTVDAVGNIRGLYEGKTKNSPRLLIASHLDTVPLAGVFDGILGVVMGIALIEKLNGKRLNVAIEVIGFSEEEGVRFGVPFIGSRALVGTIDDQLLDRVDKDGIRLVEAIRNFGLDPAQIPDAKLSDDAIGYLEFHIEQGPILENLGLQVGIVDAIAGQSRLEFNFKGKTNHAGTTPMNLRHDALAGTAEWIGRVEQEGRSVADLVATVGKLEVRPGAGNVISGNTRAILDVRHKKNTIRMDAVERISKSAEEIAKRRGLTVTSKLNLEQSSVAMDLKLTNSLQGAVESSGLPVHRMASGAGHDAMIIAQKIPTAMLFLRSPGGISHHPDESVLPEDVAAALEVGLKFLGTY